MPTIYIGIITNIWQFKFHAAGESEIFIFLNAFMFFSCKKEPTKQSNTYQQIMPIRDSILNVQAYGFIRYVRFRSWLIKYKKKKENKKNGRDFGIEDAKILKSRPRKLLGARACPWRARISWICLLHARQFESLKSFRAHTSYVWRMLYVK